MIPLTAKQKEVLEHPKRQAILDFLKSYDKPASAAEIAEGVDIPDVGVAAYQVKRLVEVELVEKIFGTDRYGAVGE